MDTILIGYRTRYTHRKPEWLQAPGVEEVCSVVDHMVRVRGLPRPEFWQHHQHPPRQGELFQWPPDLLHRLVQHKIGHGTVFER